MKTRVLLACGVVAMAAMGLGAPASAVVLAEGGEARAVIVGADAASVPEQTAARELAEYLGKVTGGTFQVVAESQAPTSGARIYVGPTAYAKEHGIDAAALGAEEWVLRADGDALILAGGRSRGTLYAAYRFLEDEVGVHWWNPFEESVPTAATLEVKALDRTGKPTFRYRDIYMLYGYDGGRFAARNRLNRDGDTPIAAEYGGSMNYGPPYHVHTFYAYVPPEQYFDTHPEWFSLIRGERNHDGKQLCLTNPELRDFCVAKLKDYIESARAAAAAKGEPAPEVFDISQNDWGGMCECPNCQAIAQAEGSEAGPLFDFVNYIADAIKDAYPEVYIDTLAYQMTQKAPKTIAPRDNVIVRLCDTTSNFTKSITDPANKAFREHLLSWARISKNLRIWDYAVTYAPYYGLPMPTVHTYPEDYQFYAEHNVEGVFTEHEYAILADMRDFKIWMMIKMLEDPYRDYGALVQQFMEGFYGPAGGFVRQYLSRLEEASDAKPSYLSMGASPVNYRYLDLPFIEWAMGVFDEAETAVASDPVLLRRVRYARLPLDRAAVVLHRRLMQGWIEEGHDPAAMPLDREGIAERYKNTWLTEIDLRIPEGQREAERAQAEREVQHLLARPSHVALAEQFRNLPKDSVYQYTPDETRNWNDVVKPTPDKEAEGGVTNRLVLSDEDMQKYKLPMPWGLYDVAGKKSGGVGMVRPEDVSGPGYHWYKMGTFPLGESYYLYFFWSWIIQLDIDNAFDPQHPKQAFDVWANIKFEGPGFPHGKPEDANAICVERIVLVKAEKP